MTGWTRILAHLDRTDEAARSAAHGVGDHFRLHRDDAPHDQDAEATGTPGLGHAESGTVGPDDLSDEGGHGEDGTGAAPPMPSVDELFARIRAGSTAAALEADATRAGDAADALGGVSAPGGPTSIAEAGSGPPESPPSVAPEEPREAAPAAEQDAQPGPDELLVMRRDELLAPPTAKLSRSIKRALGDDQNRMLDRLRNDAALEADDLLGTEDAHVEAFVTAAREHLGESFVAGTTFGGAQTPIDSTDAVEHSSAGLARAVVTMLRRQITEGAGDPGDRVGAAFREWRGERVERLAGDWATQAFASGVTTAIGSGSVRWVVTSATGCSDCADNSLAGDLAAGEAFPTGHIHPPAHPGCRCLVAPAGS